MINTKNTKADHASHSQRGLITPVAAFIFFLIALSARAADITVTTTADVVNGDVANPTALITNPGPDGISLREAILAANNAVGPHTINFAPELAGHTIIPTSPLIVEQNGVTLVGLTTSDGQPNITLDGGGFGSLFAVLFVHASDFTMTNFRIIRVTFNGINVRAGQFVSDLFPQAIRNIRIENNVFDNTDIMVPTSEQIRVYMEPEGMSVNATIENVKIARNTFLRCRDGVTVQANGTNCMIRDVVIEGNTFDTRGTSVGVGTASGSNNRVVDTRIIRNTFEGGLGPPTIFIAHLEDPLPNFENHIDSTMIFGNVYSGDFSSFVEIVSGQNNASRNVVSNTQVVNNLIISSNGIVIVGGKFSPLAVGNRVEGVRIINNTVVTDGAGLTLESNLDNTTGNSITGVDVLNTIFSGPSGFRGEVTPDQVRFCITSAPGFAGVNGNISADPLFVDPDQGDYHLQTGSPAIDAGSSVGAPMTDLECRERVGAPDIGAFEFGGIALARLALLTAGTGTGTITADPVGRDCATNDSVFYTAGSVVTLTPIPEDGSIFTGWSGDSDCSDGVVTMASDKTCTATFDTQPVSVAIPIGEVPSSFELRQNYPNPFNPATTIEFALPRSSYLTLKIFNLLGEEVTRLVDKELAVGRYKVHWEASGMASGVYLYFLQAEGFAQSKKLILLK